MPHLIEGLRHVQTNCQAVSLAFDSGSRAVGLLDQKITSRAIMAEAMLTFINQLVILQINQELTIYNALHHFRKQEGDSNRSVVRWIGTIASLGSGG